jgi:hypothetical protein
MSPDHRLQPGGKGVILGGQRHASHCPARCRPGPSFKSAYRMSTWLAARWPSSRERQAHASSSPVKTRSVTGGIRGQSGVRTRRRVLPLRQGRPSASGDSWGDLSHQDHRLGSGCTGRATWDANGRPAAGSSPCGQRQNQFLDWADGSRVLVCCPDPPHGPEKERVNGAFVARAHVGCIDMPTAGRPALLLHAVHRA